MSAFYLTGHHPQDNIAKQKGMVIFFTIVLHAINPLMPPRETADRPFHFDEKRREFALQRLAVAAGVPRRPDGEVGPPVSRGMKLVFLLEMEVRRVLKLERELALVIGGAQKSPFSSAATQLSVSPW